MQVLRYALCIGVAIGIAGPAVAAPPLHDQVFTVAPLGEQELAGQYGAGLGSPGTVRTMLRDESEAFGRQTGAIMPVTFDNWFVDVGNQMIFANLTRP